MTTEERRKILDFDKYFNAQFDAVPVYMEPGQTLADHASNKMYVANVGSGILLTMHDRYLDIGAAAYVFLPDKLLKFFPHFEKVDKALIREALHPLDECIVEMKKLGAGKNRLYVRLIGGARLPNEPDDIGTKNYVFMREYIIRRGLAIMNEDCGGTYIRRVHFFPSTGRAVRLMLRRASDFQAMQEMEKEYRNSY